MSTDFSAALRMQIVEESGNPGVASVQMTAFDAMWDFSNARLAQIAEALTAALANDKLPKEMGICGTVQAYSLIPVLAASFPESFQPGVKAVYPIGPHDSDTPWSPLRKRLAAHCLGMIETFLAVRTPSKAYKPAHGGYPCYA